MGRHRSVSHQKISALRRRYAAGGVKQRELAAELGVCVATISKWLRGVQSPDRAAKLSRQKIAALRKRLLAGGVLKRELAEEVGLSPQQLGYYVRDRRPPKLPPEQVEEARARYAAGETLAQLGQAFGVAPTWIMRHVRGVTPPPRFKPCEDCAQDRCKRHRPKGLGRQVTKRYPHGTRARYALNGCRCGPCHDTIVVYSRERTRAHLYGEFDAYVSAEPAREHLRNLAEAGVGYKAVARVCGVAPSVLSRIMGRHGKRGVRSGKRRWQAASYRPIRRLRQSTVDRVLAVTASDARPGGGIVSEADSERARRRVNELVAAGMRKYQIAIALDPALERFVRKGKRPGLQVVQPGRRMTRRTVDGIERIYVSFFRSRRMPTPEERRGDFHSCPLEGVS